MEDRRHPNQIKNQVERRLVLGTLLIAFTAVNVSASLAYLIASQHTGWPHFGVKGALVTAVTELIIMATAYLVTLRVSHHITGPIYATERRLMQVQQGDLIAHSHLRRGDQFQELETIVNKTTDDLCERVARMKILSGTLRNDIAPNSPAIAALEALERELAHFDTGDGEPTAP